MKNLFSILMITVAAGVTTTGARAQECRTVSGDEAVRTTPPESSSKAVTPEAPPKAATAADSKAPETTEEEH